MTTQPARLRPRNRRVGRSHAQLSQLRGSQKRARRALAADLDHVLTHTDGLWDDLRGQRLFITGGTGFCGSWLLESLTYAIDQLDLNTSAVVLTRDPDAFREHMPHLAGHRAVALHQGDVRTFAFPAGRFSHIIHGATTSGSPEAPRLLLDTIVRGTQRSLAFARRCGAQRFLLTSSGAVYGRQPPNVTHVTEASPGAPDLTNLRSAYGEGKRVAELLCSFYASEFGLQATIARCFAFVGPYLPLHTHFAVGNFIADGLAGGPIRVQGDGTPYRSYLYAADLVVWLWTILLRGTACRPYNVGSEAAVTIRELAKVVAEVSGPGLPIVVARPSSGDQPAERYVPSTQRAQQELGLKMHVDLSESLRRTVAWHRGSGAYARSYARAARR